MPFQIIRNDITKVKADAIVNTANPKPCVGSGTDSAIYAAAGQEQLLVARKKIGEIAPGDAACTEAYEVLGGKSETFQQRLLKPIDESSMTDVAVYKKANIDRKLFSSIRCKPDYKPKKKTALAFAIALELDLPATRDLLSRAELTFRPAAGLT